MPHRTGVQKLSLTYTIQDAGVKNLGYNGPMRLPLRSSQGLIIAKYHMDGRVFLERNNLMSLYTSVGVHKNLGNWRET